MKLSTGKYDDIIDLPHHVSPTRQPMGRVERAAQFSPFAALTGYEDAIQETGRITDQRVELGEDKKSILDEKLQLLQSLLHEQQQQLPAVEITYFVEDERKSGGSYAKIVGAVKKIDSITHKIILADKTEIPLDDVLELTPFCDRDL